MNRALSRTVTLLLLALAVPGLAAAPPRPAAVPPVGAWATYTWASTVRQEVPVMVREERPGGQVNWSITRETATPPPLYVTYAIVRGDAKTYTLQIVTHETPDGPPLSVTHVRVDRTTGKALRSVTQHPKGVVPTPESGLRPFRQGALTGAGEEVSVPAGRFAAVRAPYQGGTVWVSDQVPALGLVKAAFSSGTLELVRSGAGGAKDLLRT
jgi:hypothetical protein